MILIQNLTKVPMHIRPTTQNETSPLELIVMHIKRYLHFWIEEQDRGTKMNQ